MNDRKEKVRACFFAGIQEIPIWEPDKVEFLDAYLNSSI